MFGTVTYDAQAHVWVIECEPHIAMRLKRVFGKINSRAVGKHKISATPENAADLEWFLQRYPMEVREQKRLAYFANQHRERESMIQAILDDHEPRHAFEMAVPARQYQVVAASLLLASRRLLLADDVGLGKTASAICTLTKPETLPAVVVTLTHLPRQWKKELERFAPDLNVHIVRKGTPYDLNPKQRTNQMSLLSRFPDVIILNYHKLTGWAETLGKLAKSVIYDECQELRRHDSDKYRAARHLSERMQYRMGLSIGPDSIVELTGGPFGGGWIGGIEQAWDIVRAVAEPTLLPSGHECAAVADLGIKSRGWESGFLWKPVKTFIRHKCDRPTRTIRASGQDLLLTDDHSVFRVQDGEFDCRPSSDLSVGDIIPTDTGAEWETGPEVPVDVASILPPLGSAQVVVDLSNIGRRELGLKAWEWQNCHREAMHGERLPLAVFKAHRDKLPDPSLIYFGRSKGNSWISPTIKLSDWAYILGFFLGDGWLSPSGRVAFAVEDARAKDFAARLSKLPGVSLYPKTRKMPGKSVEVRSSNRLFSEVLRWAFAGSPKCHEKSIPAQWITTWPRAARMELLSGLIDSDGHISKRHGRRYFTTTSKGLALSILSLLRSLGAVGSLHKRNPATGGTVDGRIIKANRASFVVNWSRFAMDGDNSGHRGLRRTTTDVRFNESKIRHIASVARPNFVYDLEMDGHPSFVANGLLVHNSATPIYNYGGEMYNVLSCIAPWELGTREEFAREWCDGFLDEKSQIKNPESFGTYLRSSGLMLRRTRKDVGRELPPVQVIPHYVDSDPEALDRIQGSCAELAKLILSQTVTEKGAKMRAAEELSNKLRQATGIAKAPYVAEFVRLLVESGEKVVLYGWHREVYSIWQEKLKDLNPVLYTGSESVPQKEEAKRKFVAGESSVMMISLRSGAGLDGLQHVSRTVVFGELDWSPGVHEQCVGRVARDGQPDSVAVYYLISEEGSDPVVSEVLGVKKQQIEGIRQKPGEEEMIEKLQNDGTHIKRLAESILGKGKEQDAA